MKKGLTELVFIVDRSGSMAGLEKDTIGGFNSVLKEQVELEGEARVTMVTCPPKVRLRETNFWGVVMAKYGTACMLKVVQEYLAGHGSYETLSKRC